LPSPRNSLEGQLDLFKKTNANALLTTEGYRLQGDLGLPVSSVPSLEALLALGEVKHYKFEKSFDEAKWDPFVILHTSGSTGLPKPVSLVHGWTTSLDMMHKLRRLDGQAPLFNFLANKRLYVALPPFHIRASSIPNFPLSVLTDTK
jgi:long-subunit acyl-CoA synthetase (AMP-forming)